MQVAVFSSREYDRPGLQQALTQAGHQARFSNDVLRPDTASFAEGCQAACIFVNDRADAEMLERLWAMGIRLLALRCAGFDHVDMPAARRVGIAVTRVGAYSPYSVAEHALLLLLALARKLPAASARTREFNFALDGLVGFELHGATVGIIGTGRIGTAFAGILRGFGCRVLGYDICPSPGFDACGGHSVSLAELQARADVISLHCALNAQTRHLVDAAFLADCRPGLLLVNTSRGAVVDTRAVTDALQSGRLGAYGADVYEREAGLFFGDHSRDAARDPLLSGLLAQPQALLTGHQGFLTGKALAQIAASVAESLDDFAAGRALRHRVPD